ncbi:MAG: hypothetical protein HZT41_02140 [Dechloromonas sp.]|nr:MAG: hypothetical protein HZT41_02140 [Dechloromonas sp.]
MAPTIASALVRQIAWRRHLPKFPAGVDAGGDEVRDMGFREMRIRPHYVPLANGPDMAWYSGAEACNHERRFALAELRSIVRPDSSLPASPTCARLAVLVLAGPGA